jgi:predicted O-methyltransferase YrrM
VILARHCAEAGTKQVYAIEMPDEAYQCARDPMASSGLADRISRIRGSAPEIRYTGTSTMRRLVFLKVWACLEGTS